jgi:hypothetical protein
VASLYVDASIIRPPDAGLDCVPGRGVRLQLGEVSDQSVITAESLVV